MVKSNTNKPFTPESLTQVVNRGMVSSLPTLRKDVEKEHQRVEHAVRQFFELFGAIGLDTGASPTFAARYSPAYAPLSPDYQAQKPSGTGFFKNTGSLIEDVEALNPTNLLGNSSYSINPRFSGAKKGFSIESQTPLRVRNIKTGKFSKPSQALKNFRVEVTHTPFSKVKKGFRPEQIEADIFKGGYDEIYAKLTNQQPRGNTRHYRPAFYSFMKWWLNEMLPEII